MTPRRYTLNDETEVNLDYRGEDEVWLHVKATPESIVIELMWEDLVQIVNEMERLFQMGQLIDLIDLMESDPLNSFAGFTPTFNDAKGRVLLRKELIKRLGRMHHYIDPDRANELIDEFYGGSCE